MSSWISKFIEKKIMTEVKKQLKIEIKDGQVTFVQTAPAEMTKQCKYCNTTMSLKEVFCPKCERALV